MKFYFKKVLFNYNFLWPYLLRINVLIVIASFWFKVETQNFCFVIYYFIDLFKINGILNNGFGL